MNCRNINAPDFVSETMTNVKLLQGDAFQTYVFV